MTLSCFGHYNRSSLLLSTPFNATRFWKSHRCALKMGLTLFSNTGAAAAVVDDDDDGDGDDAQ